MPTGPEKWSVHPDLHGELKLRGLVSCLLDDEPKVRLPGGADPPPPRYKGGVLPLNQLRGRKRCPLTVLPRLLLLEREVT